MDLTLYIIFSAVFIMVIHFAFGIKNFNLFLMIGYFVLGGFIGFWFKSAEMGFIVAVVLSLIFF